MDANHVPLSPMSFLNRAADIFGNKRAVTAAIEDASVTYSELRARARKMSDLLTRMGLARGDRVAVLAPNDLPLLESHFGVPAAGCVLVALNTRLAPNEYRYILQNARPRLLIVDQSLIDRVADVWADVPSLDLVVEIRGVDRSTSRLLSYEDWLRGSDASGPLDLPLDEDQPIAINYTSGTTGKPKGAVYSHRGAYLNAMGQAHSLGLNSSSVFLWTLPMFHCNGWCMTWAVTAACGHHVALRTFDPDEVLRLIDEKKVSHFCGAPVILNAMAIAESRSDYSYVHDVTVATGGAPPSPTVIERMRNLGIDVKHLYGLTETYGPSLVCEPQREWNQLDVQELAERLARQGVRTLNVEAARVTNARGDDVPRDSETMGEIVIRSNTVMSEYFEDPDATAEVLRDGWFHTGDLAVVHSDGYIEIRDRSKDIIISGGENISSIEVENVLLSHPSVVDVAVVAAPHEKWGEVPIAFLTLRDGITGSEAEMIDWVRDRLAHFKAPKAVVFGELPKTSTGKTQKHRLRDQAAAEASSTTSVAPRSEL